MANQIVETVNNLWQTGRRVKSSTSGWRSGNAPCCIHNGESEDTRGRGGLIQNNEGISYHCFNCGFKTSYIPGRPLSYKFRKLLSWIGADETLIRQLVIDAIRIKEQLEIFNPTTTTSIEDVTYEARPLPIEARSLHELATFYELSNEPMPKQFVDMIMYIQDRKIDLTKYNFYWTPQIEYKLNYRVIIPFVWKHDIVGYTARSIEQGILPKYHSSHPPDFVFNVDKQLIDNKFVIVVEGVFDAMNIDGVAILSNECSEKQADVIDNIGKQVIVVPDFDVHLNKQGKKVWPGGKLVDQAIEYGWNVAFPIWSNSVKDVSEAVQKYGKLFVLKTILDSVQHSKLKIQLFKRKIFNG